MPLPISPAPSTPTLLNSAFGTSLGRAFSLRASFRARKPLRMRFSACTVAAVTPK